nr:hypothetical protein [Thauera butanivorans]
MRIAGHLCLAAADSAAMMLLGACLTGIGGALFSPCMEALAARIDAQPDGNLRYLARDETERHGAWPCVPCVGKSLAKFASAFFVIWHELLEYLLAGELVRFVAEIVERWLLVDEDFIGEPELRVLEKPSWKDVFVARQQMVEQVRTACGAKAAFGPIG